MGYLIFFALIKIIIYIFKQSNTFLKCTPLITYKAGSHLCCLFGGVLDSGPCSSTDYGHCVVFLGKTLYLASTVPLSTQECVDSLANIYPTSVQSFTFSPICQALL